MRLLLFTLPLLLSIWASYATVQIPIKRHWDGGFEADICFDIDKELDGWHIVLTFSEPLNELEVWQADVSKTLHNGTVFELTNKDWDAVQHEGDTLCFNILGHGDGDITPNITAYLKELTQGGQYSGTTMMPVVTQTEEVMATAEPTTMGMDDSTINDGVQTTMAAANEVTEPAVTMAGGAKSTAKFNLEHSWDNNFKGTFSFPVGKRDVIGWDLDITFDKKVTSIGNNDEGTPVWHSTDGKKWRLVGKPAKQIYPAGTTVHILIQGQWAGGKPEPKGTGVLTNLGVDNWHVPTKPNHDGSKYNYDDLLFKSILFYEAQRSGKLPKNNRIPYRGDSALGDKGAKGQDLTGGWYDAGDHVKFNFPMAWSTTALTWGLIEFQNAYQKSGQLDNMYASIKWPLDYLLKCHTGPNELYVQVGDGNADHSYWGPPEQMTMARPAYKIDASNPGTEVAMETAAAMAAGSLAFKTRNPAYSKTLLNHAKQLWEFGNKHRGKYTSSVPQAANFYNSAAYEDELAWGSAWLYKVTKDKKYLKVAEDNVDLEPAWGLSWDEKTAATQVLLYELTKNAKYKQAVEGTFKSWFPGGDITYTPKGLAWRLAWGSLRYSSNMAMAAIMAAHKGINVGPYNHWGMCQIHYALGDTGRSYVVGFGKSYPINPHHRSSSCPYRPSECGYNFMHSNEHNVHTLYGALVGGPGSSDDYTDSRENYQNAEVADDYNAAFQTAIAGLKSLWMNKQHPEQKGAAACPYSG